jgi:ribose transport system ATP-binding protein
VNGEARSAEARLLTVRGLTKRFPGILALDSVDFDLAGGEVHSLLGENGAGKSTLVKCVTGAHAPDEGTIAIDGRPVRFRNTADAAAGGIGAVYQELALVPQLSVARNLLLGREPLSCSRIGRALKVVNRGRLNVEARRALDMFGLTDYVDRPVGTLGIARGQLTEIARAVSSGARILLLDEPTSSLTPAERDKLFEHLRRLTGTGVGIIYVSHRLEEILTIADRCTILRDGRRVATLGSHELSAERMIEHMTGNPAGWSAEEEAIRGGDTEREVVLEVRRLTRRPAFQDISFQVHEGEIVGLAGLVGAGRTEVLRAIFGADARDTGELLVDRRPASISSPADAIAAGLALVTEDRHLTGIVPRGSVAANIGIAGLNAKAGPTNLRRRFGLFSRTGMTAYAEGWIAELGIRAKSPSQEMRYLSGGNQQKVILARWLAVAPRVLLLDDPTRGVAVTGRHDIHNLVRALAARGVGVVLASSDLPELLVLSHRVLVLRNGRLVAEMERSQANESQIARYAAVG